MTIRIGKGLQLPDEVCLNSYGMFHTGISGTEMMIRILLSALCASTLLASAVANGPADGPASTQRRSSPAGATVGFVNLADGDMVPPGYHVQFSASGMGIAPAGTDIANTGHHHLLIDLAEMPDPNLPLPMNDHIKHFGAGQTETDLSLSEGEHTLQLLFADYLHRPHDPVVMSDRITITVSAEAPPMPAEPADH